MRRIRNVLIDAVMGRNLSVTSEGERSMSRSSELFNRAVSTIPGGVNSPVRAFGSVAAGPIFLDRGKGASVWDVDGNEYVDFVSSWGPLILGHAHEEVVEAVSAAAVRGTSFGANTEVEIDFAELITSIIPSIEMIRMVNSGTEATMSAVRVARGATGRAKIIKFDGCYHGHGDSFLIRAGSGMLTLGIPGSPGVTEGTASDTLVASFNDIASVESLIDGHPGEIAAVIVEPVMGNAGVIPPQSGFLQELRSVTREAGILLIFDEVITGFRVAPGGAQELYGITPDLTCLGKIIGGGLPVGAFGGTRDLMEQLAPTGPIYQAGTLSGNPLAMTAGLTTLRILAREGVYGRLEELSRRLEAGIVANVTRLGLHFPVNRVGSMMSLFFVEGPVSRFEETSKTDIDLFDRYFTEMLGRGMYVAPSAFEASFISAAHSEEEIERAIEANRESLEIAVSSAR